MSTRPSLIVTLVLAALPLGCNGQVEMTLVDPAKYRFHTCTQLAGEMKALRARAFELRSLQEKAARDPGGAFVARVTYGPDYLSAVGNMQVIESEAREKDCSPPITAAGGARSR